MVVEFLDRTVPGVDNEIAADFLKILKKQKMKFKLSTKVVSSSMENGKVQLNLEKSSGGSPETIEADVVLIATGRCPYTEGLGLEKAGIEMDDRGRIKVDS